MTLRQLQKNSEKISDFGGDDGPSLTGLQVNFLNDSKLFQTFGDLILIEPAKGFNLRRMRVLRSYTLKKYYIQANLYL